MTRLRDKKIAIRVSPHEKDMIESGAQAHGMNMSEFMRKCALQRAGQTLATQAASNVYAVPSAREPLDMVMALGVRERMTS